jgi:ATP-binding cassette subfamily C protein LapB
MKPSFLRPPHMGLLLSSSLAMNALALALPLMTMQVYNRIMPAHATDTLAVLACGVIMAAFAECILRIGRSALVGMNGAHFEHAASTQAMEHLLLTEPRHYQHIAPAVLAQDIGTAARLKDYFGGLMAATLLIDLPFVAVFLGLTFYLSGWLALVPCAVLAAFAFISLHQGIHLKKLISEREEEDDHCYSFITETLQSVHTLKAMCLEAVMARRFEETRRAGGVATYRIARLQGQADVLSQATAQFMTVAVVCAGVPMVITGHMPVGTLIACVLLSGQIMQPLQRALSLWIRHQDIALAKERLAEVLTAPRRELIPIEGLGPNHGALKVDNLRFGYGNGEAIVDGASITLAPGDTVVIRGMPGSGKTTLLELFAGIYTPDRGTVTLSGMSVCSIPPAERARFIAYLPTTGLIMRGSIMDNLTGFDSRLQAQAKEIAELLGIEQAVALLPYGYDTPLEALTADQIPPGLKQRIAMARGLIHRPRFILFDNADHGLDKESYQRVFDLLAKLKGKATMVLVTEDYNIASLADRVWEMRQGRPVTVMEPSSLVLEQRWAPGVPA